MNTAQTTFKVAEIKQRLLRGEFFHEHRMTGKTTEIVEILHDHPGEYSCLLHNSRMFDCVVSVYERKYGEKPPKGAILNPGIDLRGIHPPRVIVDEWFLLKPEDRELAEYFLFAGVGSMRDE